MLKINFSNKQINITDKSNLEKTTQDDLVLHCEFLTDLNFI